MNAPKSPRAKSEAKLAAIKAAAEKAKAPKGKAPKGKAPKVIDISGMIAAETAYKSATDGLTHATAQRIRAGFAVGRDVTGEDFQPIYGAGKNAANRASEVNAYRRTGLTLGAEQAERLLGVVMGYGGRIRDAFASASATARTECRDLIANGMDKGKARIEAVTRVATALESAANLQAQRDEAREAAKVADKAESAAMKAHKVLAGMDETTPAKLRTTAKADVAKAEKAAVKAREAATALADKLPKPAPAAPKSPETRVQDVHVALADPMPLAALAVVGRDWVSRFEAAGAKAADVRKIRDILESYPAK